MREPDPASGAFRPRRKPHREDEGGDVASGRSAQTRPLQRPSHRPEPVQMGGGAGTRPSPGRDTSHVRIHTLNTNQTKPKAI